MNTELLQQVIADQKLMVARKNRGNPHMTNIERHLNSDLITVISGVRRSGKSTLTQQLADNYPKLLTSSLPDISYLKMLKVSG